MERRTLIRLLIAVGIGIPVLIEAATFAGLFGSRVGNGGAEPTPETPTEATPPTDVVGVGDELLPATPQADTVTGAEVQPVDGDREFVLTVEVTNDAETGYELRLDALTTDDGTTVPGGGRSGQIAPGASEVVTGRWTLPPGEDPAAVIVVATLTEPDGSRETVTRRVDVAL